MNDTILSTALPEPPSAADLHDIRMRRYYGVLITIGVAATLAGFWGSASLPSLGSSLGGFVGAIFSLGVIFLLVQTAGMTLVVAAVLLFSRLMGYHPDPHMPGSSLTPVDRAWLEQMRARQNVAVAAYLRHLKEQGREPCRSEMMLLRRYFVGN